MIGTVAIRVAAMITFRSGPTVPASCSRPIWTVRRSSRFVTISGQTDYFSSVCLDERAAAMAATQHLIDRGHTRIGVLSGESLSAGFHVPIVRLEGHRAALRNAGLEVSPALEHSGNFSMEGGAEALATLLDRPDPPTAVFAMSDEMAFGAIAEARSRRMRIPDDIAIVGFDDHSMSEMMGLTTIHQPMAELARTATEILITGGDIAHRRLSHQLIERASVAPPRRIPL